MAVLKNLKVALAIAMKYKYFFELYRAPRQWRPPGHFYSPIPGDADIAVIEKKNTNAVPKSISGVNLNLDVQKELLKEFEQYYVDLPFPVKKDSEFRYFYENKNYLYSDAIFLHCMIRHFRPGRIIEIGSGYSSCCILDTNELFFANAIDCVFVEPHPQMLRALIRPEDEQRNTVFPNRLQEIDIELFELLRENDLLVIDSTHVLKTGSDVERIFSEVLPRLKPGVLIHFHDIFYPFEYPIEWIREGRAWNEIYALRSFLQYNDTFRVTFFNTYLEMLMPDYFAQTMPLCLKNTGGSIWLRKMR